jgi:hypothetical protein
MLRQRSYLTQDLTFETIERISAARKKRYLAEPACNKITECQGPRRLSRLIKDSSLTEKGKKRTTRTSHV